VSGAWVARPDGFEVLEPYEPLPEGAEYVLGVDLDNVTLNYDEAFRQHVAKSFDMDPRELGVVEDWDYAKTNWPINNRDEFEALHRGAVEAGMFATMNAMEGASETMWRLSDAGVHLRIITHRLFIKGLHAKSAADTITGLERNKIPYRDLCLIASKPSVGVDLLVDDGPHNILGYRANGGEAVTFDWAYNRGIEGPRVHSWTELGGFVMQRAHAKARGEHSPRV
jgi:5'(3')-deoxyribonucleotidase